MKRLEHWLLAVLGLLIVAAILLFLITLRADRSDTSETPPAAVQGETLVARVVEVLEMGTVDLGGGMAHPYQKLLLYVERGSLAGQEIIVEEGTVNIVSEDRLFEAGDRVYVERIPGTAEGGDLLYVTDYVRTAPIFWIVALFFGLVVLVGRGKGLRSLGGTLFSLLVIFVFVIPQIIAGRDPVLVSIVGSVVLLAVSTYLVYGWNPKAHAAVAGMMISLLLTGLLAAAFVNWGRLTGLAAEEGSLLVVELGPQVNLRGLVLGGIIIGSLGVLDDICVGQASAVFELLNANRELGWLELFRRSLNVGRDHIAAMVNTLLLAYMGASMPLMLVFTIYQESLWRRLSREPIAEEIIRTMVGSVGLVLAVPITGLIASLLARWAVERGEN
ncbi:MAG: YibE/F family protein [Anaerolineae bacterium]|nr:YibE/F family protein [Anaerolineae bacterium]